MQTPSKASTSAPIGSVSNDDIARWEERLRGLPRETFRQEIAKIRNEDLLGDLRYRFGWDPDPRRSSPEAIDINRLLTRIKSKREARPQWIAIGFDTVLALAALIVALFKG
jgi:hypothetical protein